MFRVGQKVVCVDANGHLMDGLKRGGVYTVAWIGEFKHPIRGHRGLCVHLVEILRTRCPVYDIDVPYRTSRFRPLQKRTTDISVFTAMLTSNKVDA